VLLLNRHHHKNLPHNNKKTPEQADLKKAGQHFILIAISLE
jgi:hypothetical protein